MCIRDRRPTGRDDVFLLVGRATGDTQAPGRTITPVPLRWRHRDRARAPAVAGTAWPGASWALVAVGRARCGGTNTPVSYTHLRAHETVLDLVCRLLLEKKKK